jgi:hypothetical protein
MDTVSGGQQNGRGDEIGRHYVGICRPLVEVSNAPDANEGSW